ncbi:HlyD family secretion protein, partial [Burkholderia multivorans]|nr:HlyD family secretion protein [Burkholderia multivorans]
MSEVTVSPLPDRLRDRVAPTRASPLARRQARTRIARGGVRRRASARTADAPLDREPGGAPVRVAR